MLAVLPDGRVSLISYSDYFAEYRTDRTFDPKSCMTDAACPAAVKAYAEKQAAAEQNGKLSPGGFSLKSVDDKGTSDRTVSTTPGTSAPDPTDIAMATGRGLNEFMGGDQNPRSQGASSDGRDVAAGYEPPPDTEGQAPAKMVITNDATLTYKVNINLKENLPGQFEKLNKVMAPNTSGKDDLDTSVVRPNTGIVVTPQ